MTERVDPRKLVYTSFLENAIDSAKADGWLLTQGELSHFVKCFFLFYGAFGSGFEVLGSTRTEDCKKEIQKLDDEQLRWLRRSTGVAERETTERGIKIEFEMRFFYLLVDEGARNRAAVARRPFNEWLMS